MSELAAAAVAYAAERGWHVVPLVPRRKVPLTRHGLLDASSDPGLVAAWWAEHPNANIGIACGPSGLLVIDLDGTEAVEAWNRLASEHGGERTLSAATANGVHVYFAGNGRSTAGRVGPGIDTRGAGGYVVAPHSIHERGSVYRWIDADAPLAPLPEWLAQALAPPAPSPIGQARELPNGVPYTRYGLAALAAQSVDPWSEPQPTTVERRGRRSRARASEASRVTRTPKC